MSYQVLARKWRPQAFIHVVGQQHVLTALTNSLSLGRIHHAYLFSGTRGVGKTSIARLLAKGLNCENGITGSPCGQCESCREIEQGRFVDLIEIDAASRTKVEDTRDLLDNVQYAPARGRFKVYLIDEVHMLSRHSFNALLKTLEEPPSHVKFLLATTEPQKLPVTILSRCLQFNLKALDVDQIGNQLAHIVKQENISAEARALRLLARAAEGSMRDALSLTDQAIAMGQGSITTDSVSLMLGTLDDEQPLALIEALAAASGEQVMTLLNQVALQGIEWEALLVEMLRLLHRIAMLQLLPVAMNDEQAIFAAPRLRELARVMEPEDVQLYYQTLLIGRKELTLAPDHRMGVEMTLLRALAFHPQQNTHQPVMAPVTTDQKPPLPPAAEMTSTETATADPQNKPEESIKTANGLPDVTSQLLQARSLLSQHSGGTTVKKSEPTASKARSASSVLERLASVTERRHQQPQTAVVTPDTAVKKEAYRWKAQTQPTVDSQTVTTPRAQRAALAHEKTPELIEKLTQASQQRDAWSAEIATMTLPKLVQQLALHAWKEQNELGVCLHLRPEQRHLNSSAAHEALAEAFSQVAGKSIVLTIIEDDNPAVLTPMEWRQAIYEEKLAQARQSIIADTHIHTLCQFFDAELDEESIRPI